MKNPFAMMALMAAAMSAAFKENAYRDAGMALPTGRSRGRIPGAKQIMRFYRAHHGHKADDYAQAAAWYANYRNDGDAAARAREAQRKALRNPLKLAA